MSELVTVGTVDELPPGEGMCAEVGGEDIALFNIDGEFHAIENTCTHMGGDLCEGLVSDNIVECPLHSARFDVTTGELAAPPASDPVDTYPVEVDGEAIKVRVG